MRAIYFGMYLFLVQLCAAQLIVRPIPSPHEKKKATTNRITSPAPLPFWDDFSVTESTPDSMRIWDADTSYLWNWEESNGVQINATLAINPPTYKVATFDGLDENGNFYAIGRVGLTDQLTSTTIDLQGKANVVLSFFWQGGGNVEIPDKTDSLILQFYSPNIPTNGGWRTVWSKNGSDLTNGEDSVFTQVGIPVSAEFLTSSFAFRFQSYGDQDGPFDAWHLDWIYLNESRGNEDFYYLDRGLTGQLTPPLSPYQSIPVNQLLADIGKYTRSQRVQAFNLDKDLQPTEYILVIKDIINNTTIDSIEYGNEDPLFANPDPMKASVRRFIELDGIDLSSLASGDSVVLQSTVYLKSSDDDFLDGTNVNLRINDTLRSTYTLHNYFAFDDGTAEYAAGINVGGGQVAVQFWLEQPDTLTHIDIYFPNIEPASGGSALELKVFKNLNEDPLRLESTLVFNSERINTFHRYELSRPVVLSDTFYIGYQQSKSEYIGVGLDRSNPLAADYIFENQAGTWAKTTRLTGALMIRPVFDQVDDLLLGTSNTNHQKRRVFPNPTYGMIKISGNYSMLSVSNLSGKIIRQERQKQVHDFSNLKAGLYLLTIYTEDGMETVKIIKK